MGFMKSGLNSAAISTGYFAVSVKVKLSFSLMGFRKKSQKTPQKEIDKALRIKAKYFEEKLKKKKDGK